MTHVGACTKWLCWRHGSIHKQQQWTLITLSIYISLYKFCIYKIDTRLRLADCDLQQQQQTLTLNYSAVKWQHSIAKKSKLYWTKTRLCQQVILLTMRGTAGSDIWFTCMADKPMVRRYHLLQTVSLVLYQYSSGFVCLFDQFPMACSYSAFLVFL